MTKKILVFSHFFLFLFLAWFYKFGGGDLPKKFNKEQFGSYILKSYCSPDSNDFTYCLNGNNLKKRNLVVGDSSILALGNYLSETSDFIILGSGSCPLINGIQASFSSPNCVQLSKKLWNYIETDNIYNFDNVYIFHRSEYLKELSSNDYKLALDKFINLIHQKSNAKIHIIFETKRLEKDPAQCISRLNGEPLTLKYCDTFYPKEFYERVSLIKRFFPNVDLIFPSERKYDIFDFKDSVHITPKAFEKHYNFIEEKSKTEL